MIVIVEGIDRVGKTTLCKKLESVGFLYFKDKWNLEESIQEDEETMFSIGKLDTSLEILKKLDRDGINVVVDRLHLTEWVYGSILRDGSRLDLLQKLDWMLSNEIHSMLVYVRSQDIAKSNNEAGFDQTALEEKFFRMVDDTSISYRLCTQYDDLDNAVLNIIHYTFKYDFYFASPFFNPEQVEREQALKGILRDLGFSIFSPKEFCFLDPEATLQSQKQVFNKNCESIKNSLAVFAITDTKDMGTVWESGYAYGLNKPVIYFAETLGDRGFNLMLAQSGKIVFVKREGITKERIMHAIFGESTAFQGRIE